VCNLDAFASETNEIGVFIEMISLPDLIILLLIFRRDEGEERRGKQKKTERENVPVVRKVILIDDIIEWKGWLPS